jgi:hypothetical protein
MSSDLDKLGVWNLALDHLSEMPMTSLSESTAYGRWLNRNSDHIRDLFMRTFPWNFGVSYDVLTVDGTEPAFRWEYQYRLPDEWLRVLPPTYLGKRDGTPIPHEVVGEYIMCNVTPTLYLRTVQRRPDFQDWDALAVDAFALFLAYRMTYRFTGLSSHRDRMQAEFKDSMRIAYETDALETTPEPVAQHTVIDVRDA